MACKALLGAAVSCHAFASDLEGNPPPPIVLRMDAVTVEQRGMPSSDISAGEVFWMTITALLSGDLPNVLALSSTERCARTCLASWKAILEGPKPWLKSADEQAGVLQTVQGETARLVANLARPFLVEVAPADTTEAQRKQAIGDISSRPSTPSLVLTDDSVVVEPLASKCIAKLQAKANMHVETIGATKGEMPAGAPMSLVVSKYEAVDVHGWASDPEVGHQALRRALLGLAAEIVKAYPWPQYDESPSPLPSLLPSSKESTAGTDSES
jgi:hypothetical protein